MREFIEKCAFTYFDDCVMPHQTNYDIMWMYFGKRGFVESISMHSSTVYKCPC